MTYRNLKIGRHSFRVRATSADGAADPTPARRRFFVGQGLGAGPPYRAFKHGEPARMINAASCIYGSSEEFWPARSAWEVANRGRNTIVCAGGAGTANPSTLGRFTILRTNFRWVTQDLSFVDVPHAGPLKITKAPLGKDVETTAQHRGDIEFKGTRGITGTLHLKDDSITLDP